MGDEHGPWTLTRLFVEHGVSGSKPLTGRPAGAELLATIKAGDYIVCPKLDRLSRDTVDALSTIKNFRERGIHLFLLDLPGDCTGNGVAALLLGVLASVAQFERERIAERIAEGKAQQRRQHKFLGGAKQFGFKAVRQPDDKGGPSLVPIVEEQAAIATMKAMKAAKHTLREIAEAVRVQGHVVSYETVRRVLLREALADAENAV
jgi:DNA invertase Pin-like site-specific DNA recombinase